MYHIFNKLKPITLLAGLLINLSAQAEVISIDLDLTGATGVARPIVSPAKVPKSMFLSQAREIHGHNRSIAGFNSPGSFAEVYPGINMACYTDEHHFEYAFILTAGADPSQIRFNLRNVKTEGATGNGDIIYTTEQCEIYQHAPISFQVTDDGSHDTHSSLNMGNNGGSSINLTDFFDKYQDELNHTRFNIVSASESSFGPKYDFYMSKFETANEQLIRFLNNAESNPNNPRGEYMFFDETGNIWLNPDMQQNRDEMFQIKESKLQYFPNRVVGDRYHHIMDENGKEPYSEHPATGVSWYGAVKYSNWLTLNSGRGLSERCYSEGTNSFNWAPVTATNWASGTFGVGEREAWLKLRGFRLPMFKIYNSSNTNRFNEFLKAGSWTGNTNVLYGFGRNSFTNSDANTLITSLRVDFETLPVGFFDGLNILNGNRTRENNNYYGINDLSGNVDEWVNGPARPGAPDARSACGGSYAGLIQPLDIERIVPPYACGTFGGFRPITTFMPDEYTQVNILFCFHTTPEEKEELQDEDRDIIQTGLESDDEIQPLTPPGGQSPPYPSSPGGIVTDPDLFPPDPPDQIPPPGGGGGGGGENPIMPPPTEHLTIFSRNPDSGLLIDVNTPDINLQSSGLTTLHRDYYYGTRVSATAPDQTGNNQFQYWERNGSPSTLNNTVTAEMIADQEITAVYLAFIPDQEFMLYVNSTPANGVPINISRVDNNGATSGNTDFSRLYTDGDVITATTPSTFNGLNFREWLLNGRPYSLDTSVTLTMINNMTLTAAYGPTQPGKQLVVNSINPNGGLSVGVSIPDNNGLQNGVTSFMRNYNTGTEVTLTAPLVTDKIFLHWLRNGNIYNADPTITFDMQTDLTMTAVYEDDINEVILSVHSSNPDSGVNISVGTPDLDGQSGGSTSFTRRYDIGAITTVTAPATADGNPFVQWVLDGFPLSTDLSIQISMLADHELIAVYQTGTTQQYDLTVQSQNPESGVNISVSLPDVNNDDDGTTAFSRTYDEGSVTTLIAPTTTDSGNKTFNHWIIDGNRYNSRSVDVAMYADHTATAIYIDTPPDPRHVLTVQSKNPNSSVVISIDPIDVNGQQNGSTTFTRLYEDGEHVTLTARTPAFPGTLNTFKYWELDGTPWSTDLTVSVDMTRDITLTAVYGNIPPGPHTLTVQSQGVDNGVDIQISATDTNGLSNGHTEFTRTYPHDTDLTATATRITTDSSGDKHEFQHWLLDGTIYTTDLGIDLSILGNMTITAVYEPYIERTLTLNSRNPNSGITIAVGTIDNNNDQDGDTSFDRIYDDSTGVALAAPGTAPNGRDIFKGWERDGSIITTNTTINLTMYTDIEVTAVYGLPNTFDLTIKSENPDKHVDISVSTPDVNGNTDGETYFDNFIRTYNPGEDTTLTAPSLADNGNEFREWRRNGTIITTNLSVNVSMLSDIEMTAVYGPPDDMRWLVVRSENPGSGVHINIDLPDNRAETDGDTSFSRVYSDGDTVTVTAPPNAGGNEFKQWFLDGTPYTTNLSATVYMFQNHEIVAEYGPGDEEDISLYVNSINPNSGVPIVVSLIDKNGLQDGDTVFIRTYTHGDLTTLTAPEQGGTNNTFFTHWDRDGSLYSTDRTVDITMLTDVYMTAVYGGVPPPVNLTVNAKKEDGTVVQTIIGVAPSDLNGEGVGTTEFQRTYNYGTTTTLDAPNEVDGDPFLHWERNGTPLTTNRTVNIDLLSDVTMTAVYGDPVPPPEVILTVRSEHLDGPLSTVITVTPDKYGAAGGTTEFQRRYDSGTEVMLTAPATTGNNLIFDHWNLNGFQYTQPGANTLTVALEMLANNTMTAVYIDDPGHGGDI